MKISILKTRPKQDKIFAKIIMLIEGVNFSHVAVSYKDETLGIRYVAEARGSGIRILSNTQFKEDNYIVSGSWYECTQDQVNYVHKYIYEQLAKKYGFKHLIGLGIMRLKSLVFKKSSNPFKDGDYSQICCELGINVIKMIKDVVLPIDVEDFGLKEFERFDKKHGEPMPQEKIDSINGVSK